MPSEDRGSPLREALRTLRDARKSLRARPAARRRLDDALFRAARALERELGRELAPLDPLPFLDTAEVPGLPARFLPCATVYGEVPR